jgi:uncharacterized protein (DUF983 family)
MISVASNEIGIVLAIVVLLLVLVTIAASRRLAAKQELRTICPHCHALFQARARLNFVGFREMTCTHCGKVELYPLPATMVATYLVVTVAACVAIVVKLLTDPEFKMLGGLWVVVLPVALVVNRRMWRVLRMLSAKEGPSFVPMQRVPSASEPGRRVRPPSV